MITKDNLKVLLEFLKFTESNSVYRKEYANGSSIEVDFKKQKIAYNPLDSNFKTGEYPSKENPSKGFVIHRDTTLNLKAHENFVCLVCVHLLLEKGYEPKHIVLEPTFKVGHFNKPSYGDILVFDKEYKPLVLIENKTFGSEFSKEWNNMQKDGGQLFSYLGPLVNNLGFCENLVLFASDFDENLILKSHIVTLKDNENRLRELENPKTFANAQGKYFEVWDQTYAKSFETKGLFENDIDAYSIGKLKYTINDLKELSHAEIRPIYHEFATILRNNAITDFEHSFYILIDLFLCKIADERNNPDDLQFYYKGITRDTPKEYCARLLKLYQLGKRELFNVEVVNKEESDIKQIFEDTNRSITNGLFAGIKELFEEIKFYNIKKFNFIDVENKEDFEINFQILIKIAALIQDINLSNSETNHFFGDLFEGLLSKNVHQTEGQFFTPLPIVNFIIKSLPQFPASNDIKVLDYACGAGHFLTEFVKAYPKAKTFGIEKSQPLSQVAKIATIINGAKESHIVFSDALSVLNTNEVRYLGFDKNGFDCIIANPPYSVKGFLNTMRENDRKQFSLINFVEEKAYETSKSIECFFVERSEYFLKQNGLMAIILPSSILSNDKLYIKVRELLFAHFNILSIVNLGSRTFGSTGTNTIILFAQKVKKNAEGLLHTFIEKNDYTQYLSYKAIDSYIEMQGYSKDDFFAFMQDNVLSYSLETHEIFMDYKKNFKSTSVSKTLQSEWFKSSSFYKAELKEKSKEYKKQLADFLKSEEYKNLEEQECRKQFVVFAKAIECDKLKTFIQIDNNCVAVLQSPPEKIGNKTNKAQVVKFLGYDWSNRKGDEGIKYTTKTTISEDDASDESTDKDDKDAEVVNAINSIKYIDTPLYNPENDYDETKFAFAIRKHIFNQCSKFSFGKETDILLDKDYVGEMSELLTYTKLADMIDFSRASFDKVIKASVTKKVEVKSKYELVKLGDIAELQKGKSITSADLKDGNIKVVAGGIDFAYYHNESNRPANTITISASGANAGFVNVWNEPIFASDCVTVRGKDDFETKFLFNYLEGNQNYLFMLQKGAAQPHVYADDLKRFPVPSVPLDVKKKIVAECEAVDNEFENSKKTIEDAKAKIEEIMSNVKGEKKRIKDVCEAINPSKSTIHDIDDDSLVSFVEMASVSNDGYIETKIDRQYKDVKKGSYTYFGENDIIIAKITPCMENGKCAIAQGLTNAIGFGSSEFHVFRCGASVKNHFLFSLLNREIVRKEASSKMTGASGHRRVPIDFYENMEIPVPSLTEQERIVKMVETEEKKIIDAKAVMASVKERKQAVLDKWL